MDYTYSCVMASNLQEVQDTRILQVFHDPAPPQSTYNSALLSSEVVKNY